MAELIYKDEYYRIVECAIKVWKTLGYGFLEKVYENALATELRKRGLQASNRFLYKWCMKAKSWVITLWICW